MTIESAATEAMLALRGERHRRVDAVNLVPKAAGLYAFYGDQQAWTDLELTPTFEGQPLYVGKAEKSLSGRDVGTHFATGKTGSSTVRRSLGALLSAELNLIAVPRNLAKPDGSANFALEPAGDERLSDWMDRRLTLAAWVKPDGLILDDVETEVVGRLRPPLNLDKVGEPRERLRNARKLMAEASRAWRPNAQTACDISESR